MIDRTWARKILTGFGGAWTDRDAPDIPLSKSQQSDNCEFPPGAVKTRYGFGEAFDADEAIGSMRNWVSNLGNYLVWLLAGTGIRIIDVTANPPSKSTVVSTTSGVAASFADAGDRYYTAIFGTDGKGATEGRVISYPSNVLASPQDLTGWTNSGCVVTAKTVEDDNGSAYEYVTQTVTAPDATTYMWTVWVLKDAVVPATRFPMLQVTVAGIYAVHLDTATGATTEKTTTLAGSTVAVSTDGNYWKVVLTCTTDDANGIVLRINPAIGANADLSTQSTAAVGEITVLKQQLVLASIEPSAFVSDKLFPPPLTYTPDAPTEPSAGSVTPGMHRIAYCVEYRSGALLRLSPDSGAGQPNIHSFQPIEFTAAGSKNLRLVLNPVSPAWPDDVVKVRIAMTPVSNPNLYVFVPGADPAITGGGADSTTITFDISDDDLMAVAEHNDATAHRFFLTRDSDGTDDGPFDPAVVFLVGDRMGYVTTIDDRLGNDVGAIYISNRNKFQAFTADEHLIQLPGQLDIVTAFSLFGNVYMLGPSWTYSTHDNGRIPVEWPTPSLVDGQKGTSAPLGVALAPSGTHSWIANKQGLYYFNGVYSHLPISFHQSDVWRTINWNYGYQIEVVDYEERKTVMVKVPLGSATSPSHILTWNYRKGFEPDQAEYSAYTVSGYDLGAMALVVNELDGVAAGNAKKLELWLGPSDGDALLRQKTASDASPYNDNSAGIASTFKTALLPGPSKQTQVLQHHGGHFRVTGSGSAVVKIHEFDNIRSWPLRNIALQSSPGKDIFRGTYRVADLVAYSLSTSAADSWFQLSKLETYHSPHVRHR